MVLELRDKLADVEIETLAAAATAGLSPEHEDVLSALLNLGYQRAQAEKAVSQAAEQQPDAAFDAVLKRSLQLLSR
jgi:Holliday junction DNA helicase RuvA